jgi:hypothetical protein
MATRPTDITSSLAESSPALPDIGEGLVAPITGFAFWAAIALPFLHVPLVVTTGLSSTSTTTAFVALVTLNVLALLVGHSHSRD